MTFEGYTLSCGKKGLKAQGVKAAGKRIKAIGNKPRDASPRDPREGNKRPLDKKQKGPEENNKSKT
jgi:hypothetical protein